MNYNQSQNFNKEDFEQLLINHAELEKVLGVTIRLQNQYSQYDEYLNDYAMLPEIPLHDVVCIFLDMHPLNINAEQNPRYELIYRAIRKSVINGLIKATIAKTGDIFLPHETARAWARTHGLKWDIPNYRPVTTADNTSQDEEIENLRNKLEQAENEIEQLRQACNNQQQNSNQENLIYTNDLESNKPNYNPTERETHLLIIAGLVEILTRKGANINPSKYLRGKGINKSAVSKEIEAEIETILNEPTTKTRSHETIKKVLDEVLKLNDNQE